MKNKPLYYFDYLGLDKVLNAQNPESSRRGQPAHDEMLFIITHQAFELWFKQFLFELDSVMDFFRASSLADQDLATSVSRLDRMVRIQKLMIEQFDVLETMSPMDFLSFRDFLIPASGFQSIQFKIIETKLGVSFSPEETKYSQSVLREEDRKHLNHQTPTLAELIEKWLERNPFLSSGNFSFEKTYRDAIQNLLLEEMQVVQSHPNFDPEKKRTETRRLQEFHQKIDGLFDDVQFSKQAVEGRRRMSRRSVLSAIFIRMYRHYPILQMPNRLIELLVDLNEHHVLWKQRHLLVIQRMIGMRMGSGGSSGKSFLENSIHRSYVFSDLIEMPSYMVSPRQAPVLPKDIEQRLGYLWR